VCFLVLAKGGPKLQEWKRGGPILTLPANRHCNSTGLKGNYLSFAGWNQSGNFFSAIRNLATLSFNDKIMGSTITVRVSLSLREGESHVTPVFVGLCRIALCGRGGGVRAATGTA
jgi:hypothetical protein